MGLEVKLSAISLIYIYDRPKMNQFLPTSSTIRRFLCRDENSILFLKVFCADLASGEKDQSTKSWSTPMIVEFSKLQLMV